MELLTNLFSGGSQNDKKKDVTNYEKDPHKSRKKYIKSVIIFFSIIICTLTLSILWNKDKRYTVPKNSATDVSTISKMEKVYTAYNPNTHLLVSHFFVGNLDNVESAADDRNLANIKYKITYSITNGQAKKYPTKLVKVNDHYFVIETRKVEPGYKILGYQITPTKIKTDLETDCTNDEISFYMKEDSINEVDSLTTHSAIFYKENYQGYVRKCYTQMIAKENLNIRKKQLLISDDNRMLNKLKAKLDGAYSKDKSTLQQQIVDTESDISRQKSAIKESQKLIEEYKGRINHISISENN